MVQFNEIPSNNRSPGRFVEFAAGAPAGEDARRVAMIGLRGAGATVAANTPVKVIGLEDGDAYHGPTSPLAAMCRAFKRVNPDVELTTIGVTADAGGTAAAGSIGLAGTATASGELVFLVGGRRYALAVAKDTAAASLLTSLKALVAADARRYADDGTIASSALPITARLKGPEGNSISIVQTSPDVPGITVTLTQLTGGATAASLASAIAALGDIQYLDIVVGFNDTTSLTALEAEMASRFTASREIEGLVHTAMNGSTGTLTSFGNARNSMHVTCWDAGLSPTPFWEVAAQAAARDAQLADPGQPRTSLTLPDVIAPTAPNRRTRAERNLLLADGIATLRVGAGDVVQIDRFATMYQQNAQSVEDDTFRGGESMHVLSAYRQSLKRLLAQYETWKLVDDGTPLDPGVDAMTPSYARAVHVEHYKSFCRVGNMEGLERFAETLIVERHATDRNRMDTLQQVNLGNIVVTLASKVVVSL